MLQASPAPAPGGATPHVGASRATPAAAPGPLLHLTADRTLVGRHVNRRVTTVLGGVVAATVSALAVLLLAA